MTSFLVRAYAYVTGEEAGFPDTASSVRRHAIGAVAALGMTAGVTPDRYDPATPVARDQLASFLVRTRQLR